MKDIKQIAYNSHNQTRLAPTFVVIGISTKLTFERMFPHPLVSEGTFLELVGKQMHAQMSTLHCIAKHQTCYEKVFTHVYIKSGIENLIRVEAKSKSYHYEIQLTFKVPLDSYWASSSSTIESGYQVHFTI